MNECVQWEHPVLGRFVQKSWLKKEGRSLELPFACSSLHAPLQAHFGGAVVQNIGSAKTAQSQALPGIKNVIAVASGKGGVGKSTVSVNLALALAHEGARVGLLDADIYGPSQPRMMGLSGQPESSDGKTMEPLERYGVQVMSIGFLVAEDTPMIWRGPMATQTLVQLIQETHWQNLDYLVIDLPPGTGDIQLTLAQKVPLSGAVVVTTPQDIALIDARKAFKMFDKVKVPVLGVIENMSGYVCPHCGHEDAIFGVGGGVRMAEDYKLKLLGKIPLQASIQEQADNGKPTVVAEPEGEVASRFVEIAWKLGLELAERESSHGYKFPKITVENS